MSRVQKFDRGNKENWWTKEENKQTDAILCSPTDHLGLTSSIYVEQQMGVLIGHSYHLARGKMAINAKRRQK